MRAHAHGGPRPWLLTKAFMCKFYGKTWDELRGREADEALRTWRAYDVFTSTLSAKGMA